MASRLLKPRYLAGISAFGFASTCLFPHFADKLELPTLLEPVGNVRFPMISENGFKLFAVGIRQVTYLYFNVYSLGAYISPTTIDRLLKNRRWKEEFVASKWNESNNEGSNFYLQDLTRTEPSDLVLAIKPVRPTDGVHLRNGFVRLVTTRLKLEEKSMKKQDIDQFYKALEEFRRMFPKSKIDVGSEIVFTKNAHRMTVDVNGKRVGQVDNPYLVWWFFEGYLINDGISPSFVRSAADGLQGLKKSE